MKEEFIKPKNDLVFKELIELKKIYIEHLEKFNTKIYFSFLSLSITLFVLHFTSDISFWWGISFFAATMIIESIWDNIRLRNFNSMIRQINNGKIKIIQ